MSTEPRISSAIPGEAPSFASVTAHAGPLMGKFFELYSDFWQNGIVPPELKEMTRLRNARITDCGY